VRTSFRTQATKPCRKQTQGTRLDRPAVNWLRPTGQVVNTVDVRHWRRKSRGLDQRRAAVMVAKARRKTAAPVETEGSYGHGRDKKCVQNFCMEI
jgi:hypothetical protein